MIEPKWYVGSMNDALFVLTKPPSPSGSDVAVDTPHPDQEVVCKVESGYFAKDKERAEFIASAPELRTRLTDIEERYCWRPIREIHEDYSYCVAVNILGDPGDLHIVHCLETSFDESQWTHFTRFAPMGQNEWELYT